MIPFRLSSLCALSLLASFALVASAGAHETAEAAPVAPESTAVTTDKAKPPVKGEMQGRIALGTRLTDRGEYESAEIAFRQVLSAPDGATDDDTKTALIALARMYRKQGAFVKAAAVYEKYLKEYPGDERSPDVLLDSGRTMRSMGSYRLAMSRFYSVINSTLKLPDKGFEHYQQLAKTAQFEIAETHFESGNYVEAAKFFSRLSLLDLAPADRARAQFKAAYALKLQGENEAAITMLGTYLEQWPADENVPEARYLLATLLRTLGRPDEALVTTLDLLRSQQPRYSTDPKGWAYWQRRTGNQLANDFFEHGDISNAQAIYSRLAGLSDDPTWRLPVIYQVALCDERLGNLDHARAGYQEIIDATKTNASSQLTELGRMATWRLSNLDWNNTIRRQVTAIFENSTGRPRPVAPAAKTPTPL